MEEALLCLAPCFFCQAFTVFEKMLVINRCEYRQRPDKKQQQQKFSHFNVCVCFCSAHKIALCCIMNYIKERACFFLFQNHISTIDFRNKKKEQKQLKKHRKKEEEERSLM